MSLCDLARCGKKIIAHFVGLMGTAVKVNLESEAEIPNDAPGYAVCMVTVCSRILKFTSHGLKRREA
jgi:hypothetical protein